MDLEIKYKQIFKAYDRACEGVKILTGEDYSSSDELQKLVKQESKQDFSECVKGYLNNLPSLEELKKKVLSGTDLEGKEYVETYNKHIECIKVIHRYLVPFLTEYVATKSDYFIITYDTLELYTLKKGYTKGGMLVIERKRDTVWTASDDIFKRYIQQMHLDLAVEGVENVYLQDQHDVSPWATSIVRTHFLVNEVMLEKVHKYVVCKIRAMELEVDALEQKVFVDSHDVRLKVLTLGGYQLYNRAVALPTVVTW